MATGEGRASLRLHPPFASPLSSFAGDALMPGTPRSFERLAAELQRLPGIGAKSAARLAYHLLRSPREEAERLSRAIAEARDAVRRCAMCRTLTEEEVCDVCSDPERDASLLCVVEDAGNVAVIEKTREYRGRYHVLWGALSPLKGSAPTRSTPTRSSPGLPPRSAR
jgi:recombination protein RecR